MMPASLAVIQKWMQAVIQHPQGVIGGLGSDSARAQLSITPETLPDVIPATSQQSSQDRLQIYANAYFARLLEVLRSEYPTLRHYMGEELFASFGIGYLEQTPSQSYTLSQLGAGFPAHLERTRPPRSDSTPDWADFLIDLAHLERLYAEVFDGPGPELGVSTLKDRENWQPPPDVFLQSQVSIVPWVHVREFRFPVHAYITAVRQSTPFELAGPQPTWLLITRRDYVVRRQAITQAEYLLLSAFNQGRTVEEALRQMLSVESPPAEWSALLQQWFQQWTRAGYLADCITPPSTGRHQSAE